MTKCEVFFGKKTCGGVDLDVDNLNGGKNGVETITLTELGNYIYSFVVHRYIDLTGGFSDNPLDSDEGDNYQVNNIAKIPLKESHATVSVYVGGFKGPVQVLRVPTELKEAGDPEDYNWWLAFCLDGKEGIKSLAAVNTLSIIKPNYNKCEDYYTQHRASQAQATAMIQKTINLTHKTRMPKT
jgi:hypothetical protein